MTFRLTFASSPRSALRSLLFLCCWRTPAANRNRARLGWHRHFRSVGW